MTNPVDIRPDHLEIVHNILRDNLPAGVKVRVFGSRAKWSTRDASDLDLALEGETKLDRSLLNSLADAFEDSALPYKVDVVDLNRVSAQFRQIVSTQQVPLPHYIQQGPHDNNQNAATEHDVLYHPKFPKHWERHPLHGLASWVNGLAFRNIQFASVGKPVIKISEIKGGISAQTKFTQQTFDNSVRVSAGDLLFAWSGQPESSIDAYRWNGPEGWLNQHIFRVTPGNYVDDTFFYYLLKHLRPNFIAIARNKQTTGLGHVTRQDLESLVVALPPLAEQRAIAGILGALDDKIELNRRMNETLEQMARALFQSWFVDFEPVRAKMAGREPSLPPELWALFPDRLVDSDLGKIPEGWEVKTLGELIELAYGKALKAGDRKGGDIPVFGSNGQVGWHDEKLVAGPGIVVGRKGNPGVVTWSHTDFFPIDTSFYVVLTMETTSLHFLFYSLTRQDLPSVAADSAVPGLNRNLAYMNTQVVPDRMTMDAFSDHIAPIFNRRHRLEEQSRALAAQRDALLPKLVSGELQPDHTGQQ